MDPPRKKLSRSISVKNLIKTFEQKSNQDVQITPRTRSKSVQDQFSKNEISPILYHEIPIDDRKTSIQIIEEINEKLQELRAKANRNAEEIVPAQNEIISILFQISYIDTEDCEDIKMKRKKLLQEVNDLHQELLRKTNRYTVVHDDVNNNQILENAPNESCKSKQFIVEEKLTTKIMCSTTEVRSEENNVKSTKQLTKQLSQDIDRETFGKVSSLKQKYECLSSSTGIKSKPKYTIYSSNESIVKAAKYPKRFAKSQEESSTSDSDSIDTPKDLKIPQRLAPLKITKENVISEKSPTPQDDEVKKSETFNVTWIQNPGQMPRMHMSAMPTPPPTVDNQYFINKLDDISSTDEETVEHKNSIQNIPAQNITHIKEETSKSNAQFTQSSTEHKQFIQNIPIQIITHIKEETTKSKAQLPQSTNQTKTYTSSSEEDEEFIKESRKSPKLSYAKVSKLKQLFEKPAKMHLEDRTPFKTIAVKKEIKITKKQIEDRIVDETPTSMRLESSAPSKTIAVKKENKVISNEIEDRIIKVAPKSVTTLKTNIEEGNEAVSPTEEKLEDVKPSMVKVSNLKNMFESLSKHNREESSLKHLPKIVRRSITNLSRFNSMNEESLEDKQLREDYNNEDNHYDPTDTSDEASSVTSRSSEEASRSSKENIFKDKLEIPRQILPKNEDARSDMQEYLPTKTPQNTENEATEDEEVFHAIEEETGAHSDVDETLESVETPKNFSKDNLTLELSERTLEESVLIFNQLEAEEHLSDDFEKIYEETFSETDSDSKLKNETSITKASTPIPKVPKVQQTLESQIADKKKEENQTDFLSVLKVAQLIKRIEKKPVIEEIDQPEFNVVVTTDLDEDLEAKNIGERRSSASSDEIKEERNEENKEKTKDFVEIHEEAGVVEYHTEDVMEKDQNNSSGDKGSPKTQGTYKYGEIITITVFPDGHYKEAAIHDKVNNANNDIQENRMPNQNEEITIKTDLQNNAGSSEVKNVLTPESEGAPKILVARKLSSMSFEANPDDSDDSSVKESQEVERDLVEEVFAETTEDEEISPSDEDAKVRCAKIMVSEVQSYFEVHLSKNEEHDVPDETFATPRASSSSSSSSN